MWYNPGGSVLVVEAMTVLSTFRRVTRRRPYRLLQVEPTLRCNLRCVMCPWLELRAEAGDMVWETFQRLVPYLRSADGLDLTGGGEPLVQPRLVDMVRAGKQAGCTVGFSTNGVLLDAQARSLLLGAGVDWVALSLDAAVPETYASIRPGASFDAVVENIARLADAGRGAPSLSIFFVMMRQNVHELPTLVSLASQAGVRQIVAKNLDVMRKDGDIGRSLLGADAATLADASRWIAEAARRADRLKVRFRAYPQEPNESAVCEQDPQATAFINWEGWVSPCIGQSYAGWSWWNGAWREVAPCRWGNVRSGELPEILASAGAVAFRDAFGARRKAWLAGMLATAGDVSEPRPARPPAPEGCRTCAYLYGV